MYVHKKNETLTSLVMAYLPPVMCTYRVSAKIFALLFSWNLPKLLISCFEKFYLNYAKILQNMEWKFYAKFSRNSRKNKYMKCKTWINFINFFNDHAITCILFVGENNFAPKFTTKIHWPYHDEKKVFRGF